MVPLSVGCVSSCVHLRIADMQCTRPARLLPCPLYHIIVLFVSAYLASQAWPA